MCPEARLRPRKQPVGHQSGKRSGCWIEISPPNAKLCRTTRTEATTSRGPATEGRMARSRSMDLGGYPGTRGVGLRGRPPRTPAEDHQRTDGKDQSGPRQRRDEEADPNGAV